MRKIKLLAAFFLSAVMILVSGADSIRADTFFSQLFRGASKSSDLVVVLDAGHGGSDSGKNPYLENCAILQSGVGAV